VDVPLVLVGLGGVLVLLGLAGGGIKTKWVEVSSPLGRGIRVVSVVFGILCVGSGGILFFLDDRAGVGGGKTVPAPPENVEPGSSAGGKGGLENLPRPSVSGRVVDVFDNPREGVIVLARGIQRYGITDDKGRFVLDDVPSTKGLVLDAFFGDERDSAPVSFDVPARVEAEGGPEGGPARGSARGTAGESPGGPASSGSPAQGLPAQGEGGAVVVIPEPLVLNPVRVAAVLCRRVEQSEQGGLRAVDPFGGEDVRVPLESLAPSKSGDGRELWCFVQVFGPDRYEIGRCTDLRFEWEWDGELHGKPYTQSVGVRPYGWRTRVSKRVWGGEWILSIGTRHAELARLSFEVY
jgi:hypothetical protein